MTRGHAKQQKRDYKQKVWLTTKNILFCIPALTGSSTLHCKEKVSKWCIFLVVWCQGNASLVCRFLWTNPFEFSPKWAATCSSGSTPSTDCVAKKNDHFQIHVLVNPWKWSQITWTLDKKLLGFTNVTSQKNSFRFFDSISPLRIFLNIKYLWFFRTKSWPNTPSSATCWNNSVIV